VAKPFLNVQRAAETLPPSPRVFLFLLGAHGNDSNIEIFSPHSRLDPDHHFSTVQIFSVNSSLFFSDLPFVIFWTCHPPPPEFHVPASGRLSPPSFRRPGTCPTNPPSSPEPLLFYPDSSSPSSDCPPLSPRPDFPLVSTLRQAFTK